VYKLLLFVKVGALARMNDESENMERKEHNNKKPTTTRPFQTSKDTREKTKTL
jgi:hypothetical protein